MHICISYIYIVKKHENIIEFSLFNIIHNFYWPCCVYRTMDVGQWGHCYNIVIHWFISSKIKVCSTARVLYVFIFGRLSKNWTVSLGTDPTWFRQFFPVSSTSLRHWYFLFLLSSRLFYILPFSSPQSFQLFPCHFISPFTFFPMARFTPVPDLPRTAASQHLLEILAQGARWKYCTIRSEVKWRRIFKIMLAS